MYSYQIKIVREIPTKKTIRYCRYFTKLYKYSFGKYYKILSR